MKLQKQLSRKYGGKEYPKWVIIVSPKRIAELGWQEGESLETEVKDQELIIKVENPEKAEKRKEAANKAWKTRKKNRK
jgi:antitoxin component of MazEF toxin-antitoxin module